MNRYRVRLRQQMTIPHYGFPIGVVLTSDLATAMVVAAALAQRVEAGLVRSSALGAAIAVSPVLIALVVLCRDREPPLWVLVGWMTVAGLLGSALLFLQEVPNDFAPLMLMMTAAQVAATSPKWSSLPVAALGTALLAIPASLGRIDNAPLYYALIALGWSTGVMVRTQLTVYQQEQQLHADRAAEAAGEERRRIAREVHDVIAHSLSITLLHLTGARRMLQVDRDVDEAIDALTDAERLGRQAMSDIRRTVGLLDAPAGVERLAGRRIDAEPGVDRIDELIADFVRAGVRVQCETAGDTDVVSAAVGLALYRIAQESLANVVKHAPGAQARVRLRVGRTAELTVENDRTQLHRTGPTGTGVVGMGRRARLLGGALTAGPVPGGWRVHAEFPVGDQAGGAGG